MDLIALLHVLILIFSVAASCAAAVASVATVATRNRIQQIEVRLNGHLDELVRLRTDEEVERRMADGEVTR